MQSLCFGEFTGTLVLLGGARTGFLVCYAHF
jgi:hypothetical protein